MVGPTRQPGTGVVAAGDLVTWEAILGDDAVQREADGVLYADVNRQRLRLFRLRDAQGILIDLPVPDTGSGYNLIYRRRIEPQRGPTKPRKVFFIVGWVPMGPVIFINPDNMTFRTERSFIPGDPDLYPPVPHPKEGERFTAEALVGV